MPERLEELSDQELRGVVAVCDDLEPGRRHRTRPSPRGDHVGGGPEGATALPVPAGTRAVFTTSGPAPEAVRYLWRDVLTQRFPSHPYRNRPGPEVLRVRRSPDGAGADAELWLPVEREQG
ncbi:Integron-associated effector binding protein domain-containing protein OS=Streptomyces griseomycini OX=66895 GN=FHS37_005328 PE=4 SV=1 [Streptomyces griseomycini]|uniref:Integron-associated effector binding protein domain-containing protein n=1 Tax=Streptomyces griseomycini TaxID=66895 RepID=A0A7W7PU14_9ACTN|nr:hypothetical protein [Streptomyces griseomycini]GGR23274.1 hypothetical protein GCM10015536_31120 [Streptomyces griseomycini]